MKTLCLVRHAKCISKKRKIPDFERALIPKGEKEAKRMAKQLKKEGILPDLMISSPANRVLETAHIFAQSLRYSVQKIMLKEAIYENVTVESLLNIVREVDDKYHSVMLFGHNPILNDFASLLLKDFQHNIPKAGVICIDFRVNSWKKVSQGKGKLKLFDFPINKAQKFEIVNKAQKELEVKIFEHMNTILNEIDTIAAKKMNNYLKKSSEKLARKFAKVAKKAILRAKSKMLAEEIKSEHKKSATATEERPTSDKVKITKDKKPAQGEAKPKPDEPAVEPKNTKIADKEKTKPTESKPTKALRVNKKRSTKSPANVPTGKTPIKGTSVKTEAEKPIQESHINAPKASQPESYNSLKKNELPKPEAGNEKANQSN